MPWLGGIPSVMEMISKRFLRKMWNSFEMVLPWILVVGQDTEVSVVRTQECDDMLGVSDTSRLRSVGQGAVYT